MFSKKIQEFFIPIFTKHKKVFILLLIDGLVSGLFSVILPILLKLETDQLVAKKTLVFLSTPFNGFAVFTFILLTILVVTIITRLVSQIVSIMLEAERNYLENTIQLELFSHMNMMEVGKTMNSRFKNLSRVLDNEFSDFSKTVMNIPRDFLQKTIEVIGITGLFLYFDIRLLLVVIGSAIISYGIDRYADLLRRKYDIQWKFSLGQKVYFYNDLFLRSFPELATNGAVKTTLTAYKKLLDTERLQ